MKIARKFRIHFSAALAVALSLSACSNIDDWKIADFDYFRSHPLPTQAQMVKKDVPDSKATAAAKQSQTVLDQMAGYDKPLAGPVARGEGGLISEFRVEANTASPPVMKQVATEPSGNILKSLPLDQTKPPAPKTPVVPKNPDANANGNGGALELRQMLEGQDAKNPNNGVPASALSSLADSSANADPRAERQVEINFNNTSLRAVVEFVFGEYIKKPYVIASDFVDKEVNWVAQGEFSNEEIKRMFESFLDAQGIVVKQSDGVFVVANRGADAKSLGSGDLGIATGIWRLRHVDAAETMLLIRPFVSNPEAVALMDKRNTMIVTASGPELRYIDAFLRSVDTPNFKDKRILVYSPQYISAESMVTLIQALPQQLGMNSAEGKKQIEAAIIAGTKRVVIVADGQESRDVVMQYINQIDRAGARQKQIFYYALRNQVVDEVKNTLSSLLPGVLPDAAEVTVVSNLPTNSLVITATADQYFEIKKVIDRLDYRVPSVLIDATIVEVQLNDNLAYGVEWFLGGRVGKIKGDITTDLTNAAAIASPATRIGVVSLSNNTFATIDLLASETNLRVLSRPRVLVKNKATATIKSTDQVRIVKSVLTTSVQQGGDNIPKREFEDKEVGVSLQVTPRIAEDGTVNMAVKIQDSRQGADDDNSGERPRFNVREVNTELVTKNGETILIGGLIRNNATRTKSKVPFFGDLPIVGQAFSNTNDVDQRTELVIFMTPYLVVDEVSARLVSESISGLVNLNPELAKNSLTPDPDLSSPVDKSKPAGDKKIKPVSAAPVTQDEEYPQNKPMPENLFAEPPPIPPSNIPPPPPPPPSSSSSPEAGRAEKFISNPSPKKDGPPTLAPDDDLSSAPVGRVVKPLNKPLLQ